MSLLASIHGRTPFVFCTKKAAVPYEVGNCGFCVDVRYLGCGQVSTGPKGPMGAISDLAKSGLNTGRAYHIRSSLDSCGFLHRYFSAKCPHSSKKLARCCVASIISRKVKRFLHSEWRKKLMLAGIASKNFFCYNSTIEKIWTGRSSLSISFIFPAYSEMGGIRFERHGHRGSTAWTGQHGKLYPSVPFFSERALHLFVRYRRSAAY